MAVVTIGNEKKEVANDHELRDFMPHIMRFSAENMQTIKQKKNYLSTTLDSSFRGSQITVTPLLCAYQPTIYVVAHTTAQDIQHPVAQHFANHNLLIG